MSDGNDFLDTCDLGYKLCNFKMAAFKLETWQICFDAIFSLFQANTSSRRMQAHHGSSSDLVGCLESPSSAPRIGPEIVRSNSLPTWGTEQMHSGGFHCAVCAFLSESCPFYHLCSEGNFSLEDQLDGSLWDCFLNVDAHCNLMSPVCSFPLLGKKWGRKGSRRRGVQSGNPQHAKNLWQGIW